jgi:hypothetical protein
MTPTMLDMDLTYKCNFFKPYIFLVIVLYSYNIKSYAQDNTEACKVVNNDFANLPFGKVLSPEAFLKLPDGPVTLEKKAMNNPHTGAIDTIYCYTFFSSVVAFYKTTKSNVFRSAQIQDSGIKLKYGIEVGNSRLEVLDKLKAPDNAKCDMLLVSDDEDFAHHKFYFKNNRLIKVELDTGAD